MEEVLAKPLIKPVVKTGRGFYALVVILSAGVLLGIAAYIYQLARGLGVTALNSSIIWGLYISSFVFFIGISHSGTLISAVLRVTRAEWRRPITRLAETVTVLSLIVAAAQVAIFDLGRPDRLLHIILFGRLQSPLTWDLFSITTYLVGAVLYLYVAMIPDLAIMVRSGVVGGWRKALYEILSLNWAGSRTQMRRLEGAMWIMATLIIPVMVTVHTVVSWTMAMTLRPTWHSTVFGPYFVTGAVYSGIAAVITVIWFYRRFVEGADRYIKEEHFRNLGWLLFALNLALGYMTINHVLTDYYGGKPAQLEVLNALFFGEWAPAFWSYITANLILPVILMVFFLLVRRDKMVDGLFVTSIVVNVGMYLERYVIVAPALSRPFLPYPHVFYFPTWVELAILIGSLSGMALMYVLFFKVFPPIPIWEVRHLDEKPEEMARLCGGAARTTAGNSLPRFMLAAVVGAYLYLMYLLVRSLLIPVYSPEGFIVANEAFKIVLAPIAFLVTLVWFLFGYVIYQLVRISEGTGSG